MATGGLWRKENRNEYKTEQIFGRGGTRYVVFST